MRVPRPAARMTALSIPPALRKLLKKTEWHGASASDSSNFEFCKPVFVLDDSDISSWDHKVILQNQNSRSIVSFLG